MTSHKTCPDDATMIEMIGKRVETNKHYNDIEALFAEGKLTK